LHWQIFSSAIDLESFNLLIFSDLQQGSSVLKLLKEMEQIENESHLCIQRPHTLNKGEIQSECPDGNKAVNDKAEETSSLVCLQQNFKLEDDVLYVKEESVKDKLTPYTVIYLRVRKRNSYECNRVCFVGFVN